MSTDVQSATVRGVVACGDQAEQFKSEATAYLESAGVLLRAFWQDPDGESGFFHHGIELDGSDKPAPMGVDAIPVMTLVDLARQRVEAMARSRDRIGVDVPDTWPVTQVLLPARDILDVASRGAEGALSPAIAYAVGGLLHEACCRLDAITLAPVAFKEAA